MDIIGRAKVVVETALDKSSLDTSSGTIGSSLKRGAVVGVAALGTLTVAGVKAFTAFEEAEAQSRKLANVLGNMGVGSAAAEVEKLASALQRQTGVSDETIKAGQTILATFSQVASSAGQVGGTFERATKLSLDLAAAGFGSVESASVMLGKALQDPEKGLTALGRAGVTFTEEQKALIEGFLAVNDSASAQKVILEEIEKQVGGTAEASATQGAKIKEAFGELQETFGLFIDDVISGGDSTKTFSDRLFDLNENLKDLEKTDSWKAIATGIRGIGKAVEFVVGVLDAFTEGWINVGEAVRDFTDHFRTLKNVLTGSRDITSPLLGAYDFMDLLDNGRASGGPASGWTLVGERGPEIVNLPNGSYVNSNSQSREMVAASSGGGDTFNINYVGSMEGLVRELDWRSRYRRVGA